MALTTAKTLNPFVDFVFKVSFHPDNKQQILHIDTETQNIQLYWRNLLFVVLVKLF